jgi:predicted nucleic acid-binding protein
MTERYFVDTNVLVYSYSFDQPSKQATASAWIERLWREQSARASMQVLNELYATLRGKLRHQIPGEQAWDIVQALLAWDPQPIDRDVLFKAQELERRYRISWWDSLIVAAAQLQDCDVLLTEDLQPGMSFDRVTVHNPFRPGVQEPRAVYQVEKLPPRHRPRGRPRKIAARAQ